MQIDNLGSDEVWFWYDPAADMILQEEVEPYDVVGLFESEDDADRVIQDYGDRYDMEDLSALEKYKAELNYEEQGPILGDGSEGDGTEKNKQTDVDEFLPK